MSDNHAHTADPAASHGIDDMAAMNFAPDPVASPETKRSAVVSWLVRDMAYIAMLLLALIGVGFHLPVSYWLVLFPLFGIISAYEGRVRGVSLGEQIKSVMGIAGDLDRHAGGDLSPLQQRREGRDQYRTQARSS